MVPPRRLNLQDLSPAEREKFQSFTEPRYYSCLEGKDPYGISNTPIVAVGSLDVGLALASVHPELNMGVIHSIQGSEEQLLQILEQELAKEEAFVATFSFSENSHLTEVLEKRNWEEPELSILQYFYDCYIFNPPWFNKLRNFPKVIREFPWKKLTPKEKSDLLHKIAQGRVPMNVSPFGIDEKTVELINSLGLRYKREVIGWSVTQRVAPDTIKYSFLYLDPDFQFMGNPIRLLADSIKLQQKSDVQWSIFEINIDQSSLTWLNFVEKRLAPYAQKLTKIYKTWKSLNKSSGQP